MLLHTRITQADGLTNLYLESMKLDPKAFSENSRDIYDYCSKTDEMVYTRKVYVHDFSFSVIIGIVKGKVVSHGLVINGHGIVHTADASLEVGHNFYLELLQPTREVMAGTMEVIEYFNLVKDVNDRIRGIKRGT